MNRQDLCIVDGLLLIKPLARYIKETSKLRWFKRGNGEVILQKAFLEVTEYEDGREMTKITWKDIETVCEE